MKRYMLLFLFLFKLSYVSASFVDEFTKCKDDTLNFFDETLEKYNAYEKLIKPAKNSPADKALIAKLIALKELEADGTKIQLKRNFIKADIIDGKVYVFYSLPQLNIIMKYVCEFKDIDSKYGFLAEISCFHNIDDASKFDISIIGHIAFRREDFNESFINFIEIEDVFRGYGLGTIIFGQAIKFIENENKCGHIRLIVMNGVKNLAAVKMYESQGFKWKHPDSFDSAEMIKEIKPKSKL